MKSINAKERKDHCIREHNFPSNFRFDKQITKLSPPKKKVDTLPSNISSEDETMEPSVDEVEMASTSAASASAMPINFNFGHSKTRTFKNVNSYAMATTQPKIKPKQRSKSTSNMLDSSEFHDDLMESLPK